MSKINQWAHLHIKAIWNLCSSSRERERDYTGESDRFLYRESYEPPPSAVRGWCSECASDAAALVAKGAHIHVRYSSAEERCLGHHSHSGERHCREERRERERAYRSSVTPQTNNPFTKEQLHSFSTSTKTPLSVRS